METKDINKQEYQLRINKVTDYIHNHIDQPLSLQKMAGIACFSPFHFHRVFTILTGETPTDYIKRTRIEKAALLLKRNEELSATEIALRELSESVIAKLKLMTDEQFAEVEFPLD